MSESKLKLTWGDKIKNRAKKILHVLLLYAKNDKDCLKKCFFKKESTKSNVHILEFEITIDDLSNLMKEYSSELEKYPKDTEFQDSKHLNNHINKLLIRIKELGIIDDKRDSKTQGSIKWIFNLELPHLKLEIDKNLDYLCQKWDEKRPEGSKRIAAKSDSETDKTQTKNNRTESEKIQTARKLLRSFDCVTQESNLKPKIVKDKCGIFTTQVDKSVEFWFRWRLTKCMGDFEKIKTISIDIDFNVVQNFNHFWQKFGKYIGKKGNLDSETVIKELIELCKTQPVMIVINNVKNLFNNGPLFSSEKEMFDFCSHLFKSFNNKDIKNDRSYLVIFLTEEKKTAPYTSKEYSTQTQSYNGFLQQEIIDLEFTKFLKEEIENWLHENQSDLEEKKCDVNKGHQMMDFLLKQESYTLLDEICQHVFKLEEGIADVEECWRKLA